MEKRIRTTVLNFVIVGSMLGAIMSLLTSYFLNYIVESYSSYCSITYMGWLAILAPCFAFIGGLFNAIVALFIYEEHQKKKGFNLFNIFKKQGM